MYIDVKLLIHLRDNSDGAVMEIFGRRSTASRIKHMTYMDNAFFT